MGTFLSNALAAVLLVQSPPQVDSVTAALWARVATDSTDATAWLELGQVYLQRGADYHAHRKPVAVDTAWAHATLDTAQLAFERAARFSTGTRTADSARVYRVYAYGERASVDWEAAGATAATLAWHALPEDLRLPPVLEELGENLLRACPHRGVLLTAGETDTQAAWYLRFSRGLRPDLIIVPWERWRGDSVLRNRVARELRTHERSLRALSQSRAVCASMALERPPDERSVKWNKRPLVWVTGKESQQDRVPAQDFVFAALRQAVDEHETWTAPVTAIYRRATSSVGDLCKAFDTFRLGSEVGCH
jgi:hypothetical protein